MHRARRSIIAGSWGAGGLPLFLLFLFLTPDDVGAQTRDSVHCCTVVRVDAERGVITARETSTGYTFRIDVKNRKHRAAIKVGDKVWANFVVKKVRLEAAGDSLCCAIVETAQTPLNPAISIAHPHIRS